MEGLDHTRGRRERIAFNDGLVQTTKKRGGSRRDANDFVRCLAVQLEVQLSLGLTRPIPVRSVSRFEFGSAKRLPS